MRRVQPLLAPLVYHHSLHAVWQLFAVFHHIKPEGKENVCSSKDVSNRSENLIFYITFFCKSTALKKKQMSGKSFKYAYEPFNNFQLSFIVSYFTGKKGKKICTFYLPLFKLKNTMLISVSWKYLVHKKGHRLCGFIVIHCAGVLLYTTPHPFLGH